MDVASKKRPVTCGPELKASVELTAGSDGEDSATRVIVKYERLCMP